MNSEIERLNDIIERMQAGKSLNLPGTTGASMVYFDAGEIEVLQLAAQLSAARPGADQPAPAFVARLRAQMLAEAAGA
jgi:hypothetical protein